ncbi:hypothetical protein V0288_18855 [Pannus brasiliensis CCIBt3594]|uniref:Uncharacterized protein n=1 Tax=Pannus brasiliensis CCIBt3594 TaxID=1427578 RepID=A0AAW9QZE2_9CHRO
MKILVVDRRSLDRVGISVVIITPIVLVDRWEDLRIKCPLPSGIDRENRDPSVAMLLMAAGPIAL